MAGIALPALRAQITSRRLAPLYVLTGEDTHLIDQLVDEIG